MMDLIARPPRVLVVGAYERDNFGDLLFLLVTERYLRWAEVHSAAPFSADMTALLDREVHAYGPLLRSAPFDVIWTAGGQVGGTDLRTAYRLSAPAASYRSFQGSSETERAQTLRRVTGETHIVSPYLPSPIDYPLNAGAVTVLNSVGVAGIRGVNPARREELVSLLRGTTFITVRDKESSDYLTGLGIVHRLGPDVVHAIGVLRPGDRDPDSDVAVIQASSAILKNLGHGSVAARIAGSRQLKGLRVRLLMAGTATGHDSVDDYAEVVARVRESEPGMDIEIVKDRRPFDLVDHIRRARIVVGTSLHVRVIACAYGVPRVTLARTKPTRYARVWDPGMPFDVSLDELDDAIEAALSRADRPEILAAAEELSHLAHENLSDLVDKVTALLATQTDADRAHRIDVRRRQRADLQGSLPAAQDAVAPATRDRTGRLRRLLRGAARRGRRYAGIRPFGSSTNFFAAPWSKSR